MLDESIPVFSLVRGGFPLAGTIAVIISIGNDRGASSTAVALKNDKRNDFEIGKSGCEDFGLNLEERILILVPTVFFFVTIAWGYIVQQLVFQNQAG